MKRFGGLDIKSKTRFFRIRYKAILAYLLCTIISAVSMTVSGIIFIVVFNDRIYDIIRWLNKNILAIPIILFIIMLLFFGLISALFLLFTNKHIKYLEDITKVLQDVSGGNMDIQIPVKTSDELGKLAETVNSMTCKLKLLIEKERNWERTKNELINNVSHDLRTPLTSILGYVDLISRHQYNDDSKLQQYVEIVQAKCNNLNKLINDLFEYSKFSSREVKLNKIKVNVAELLEQVIAGFLPVFNEEGIKYNMRLKSSETLVLADPVLLARLFDNLVNNAVVHGKEGKLIEIELESIDGEAVIRVINYGETIGMEDLPYIFERLYRSNASGSGFDRGSGLGLAIVRSITNLHSGKVGVTSVNNTTTFEVRLNIA